MQQDPLAGLDDVPWAELKHNFGPVDAVPSELRALQAGQSTSLWSSSVYQTAHDEAAVPFLVRLALDARVPDRHEIVRILINIAIRSDRRFLPNGYNAPDPLTPAQAEAMRQWVAESEDEAEREWRAAWGTREVQCYDAVRTSLPQLTGLLKADSSMLRAEVANLLAWFPDFADVSVPLLTAYVADETAPAAAATGLVALGLLDAPDVVPLLRKQLDSHSGDLRWASAFALTRLGVTESDVVDALLEAIVQPPVPSDEMRFLDGDHRSLATMALRATPEATVPRAIDAVLLGLANCKAAERSWFIEGPPIFYSYDTAQELFQMVFPGAPPEPPRSFDDLSGVQQQVVGFIVGHGPTHWSSAQGQAFKRWNIPTDYDELCVYAGMNPVPATNPVEIPPF